MGTHFHIKFLGVFKEIKLKAAVFNNLEKYAEERSNAAKNGLKLNKSVITD